VRELSGAPTLLAALIDKSVALRAQAAELLGECGQAAKGAVPRLIAAARDPFPSVRKAAIAALPKIGRDAVPEIVETLKNKNSDVRALAARILAEIGLAAKDGVPALTAATNDSYAEVGLAAKEALQRIQAKK
jgi:HEAT repeat protein